MSKVVKVTYNSESLQTEILVDGQAFDTSRINGKEIADWAYPFMMRKVKWNGFYDEMVEALGGEKTFDLIFDGSEEALNELKEAWEDAPVNVISEDNVGNNVVIEYDESTLNATITVNGTPFDTSRINGKEIEDWVYPFMVRKVKWDGIFEELEKVIGSDEYTIQFSGSNSAMKALMEECPETIEVVRTKNKSVGKKAADNSNDDELQKAEELFIHSKTKEALPIFEKLAENGNGRAMFLLSICYTFIDRNKRIYWLNKGADAGDPLSKLSIAQNYSDRRIEILNEILPVLSQMADEEDIIAQCEIVQILYGYTRYGKYESYKNFDIMAEYFKHIPCIKYLKNASEKYGYAKADYILGNCYEKGCFVERDTDLSVEHFTKAANQNYLPAMFALGRFYMHTHEDIKQFTWFLKAAEEGHTSAFDEVANCYYYGIGTSCDYDKAFYWAKKAISDSSSFCDSLLGNMYYFGRGTKQNYSEAVKYFKEGADYDDEAQYKLGECYYYGRGVEQNYEKAVEWYTKAAEEENNSAQAALGDCYYLGNGVKQNYEKAVEWYTKAAEQGDSNAQDTLGDCYYFGNGVEQNYEKAVEWYTEAAESNNIYAMYDLAVCYYYGKGTSQNYQEAVRLFQLAANEGNVESLNFLGDCYYEGNGVKQSYSTAVSLYNEAMSNNSPQAYYNLGSCYRWGNGVPKDKAKAKELFKKGIELGSTNCSEAYEDMLKNDDKIKMAKKIGGEVLNGLGIQGGILGGLGMLGKACINSLIDNDDDDED